VDISGSEVSGGTETILIVEDEDMLRSMLQERLESKGYRVYAAADGLEAVSFYSSHRTQIDLVLTDVGLPKMTGIEEFNKLKEINPNVKVLLASGFFEPHTKSKLYKAGAKGFIQKPYIPEATLRKIREVLDMP
jgi:CheY-like chemotaxis protein